MASGFIIFKDGRCFARRWTGYDEIIQIAINELEDLENGQRLSEWLKLQIPGPEDDENSDAGWGFYNSRIDEWINRQLDLRSLTSENQALFWMAIKNGRLKLKEAGKEYSPLDLDLFEDFYQMHLLCEKGDPPLDNSDWGKLADPCIEKNGPGWND